jgi:hypothetical protein
MFKIHFNSFWTSYICKIRALQWKQSTEVIIILKMHEFLNNRTYTSEFTMYDEVNRNVFLLIYTAVFKTE